RSRVLSRTLPCPLTTRETVIGETFASAATSSRVTACPLRRAAFLGFCTVVSLAAPRPSVDRAGMRGTVRWMDATSFATRPDMRACGMLHTTVNGRQHPRPGTGGRFGRWLRRMSVALLGLALLPVAQAEDGYELWLRYRPLEAGQQLRYRPHLAQLVAPASTPTQRVAREELLRGLVGQAPAVGVAPSAAGAVLVGTPASLRALAGLGLDLEGLGDEGYLIRSVELDGRPATVVAANSDVGALYGSFHLLRLLQTR